MNQDVYKLKKYQEESAYVNFEVESITKQTTRLQYISFQLCEGEATSTVKRLNLPKYVYKNLLALLSHFELETYEIEFLSFISISQEYYLFYKNKKEISDEMTAFFIHEKRDLNTLLDALERYLFDDSKDLYSISFKFLNKPSKIIKNFFVLDDIYKSIVSELCLNRENFQVRKKELLSETNDFNFKKGEQYIIMKIVQALFDFLKAHTDSISDNKALKFCGVFLHICQIPSNRKSNDIAIEKIEDALFLIDHQNLMHLKNGRLSYKFKT